MTIELTENSLKKLFNLQTLTKVDKRLIKNVKFEK